MMVSPATALATALPIDPQGVAAPHEGPSLPVLPTWRVADLAVAGIASTIARTATAGRRDCLIKILFWSPTCRRAVLRVPRALAGRAAASKVVLVRINSALLSIRWVVGAYRPGPDDRG